MESVEGLAKRDAAIEEVSTRLGVRAERGKRFGLQNRLSVT